MNCLLEDMVILTRQQIILQHDGTPAHFSRLMRGYLNEDYTNRQIGCGGPHSWPQRSPDLNPLDYYLWVYLTSLVYETSINNTVELNSNSNGTSCRYNIFISVRVFSAEFKEYLLRVKKITRALNSDYTYVTATGTICDVSLGVINDLHARQINGTGGTYLNPIRFPITVNMPLPRIR